MKIFEDQITFYALVIVVFIAASLISFHVFDKDNYNNPAIDKHFKNEVVLIYIGCSTCGAAQHPDLPGFFQEIKRYLQEVSRTNEHEFMTVGVSSEHDISRGLVHLEKFSAFDEISIGNGLGNRTLQFYIWENSRNITSSGLPQVLVSKRTYQTYSDGSQETVIHPQIIMEEVAIRKVGVEGIMDLAENKNQILSKLDFDSHLAN